MFQGPRTSRRCAARHWAPLGQICRVPAYGTHHVLPLPPEVDLAPRAPDFLRSVVLGICRRDDQGIGHSLLPSRPAYLDHEHIMGLLPVQHVQRSANHCEPVEGVQRFQTLGNIFLIRVPCHLSF